MEREEVVTGSRVLVTGGAGFIGSNLVHSLLSDGHTVTVFDDLSRRGAKKNAEWLAGLHGRSFKLVEGDTRDARAVTEAVRGNEAIYHFAAQVAVTTSVTDPRQDFDINALGTFNVLDAARTVADHPVVLFTSTNKVYGGMEDVVIEEQATRYAYRDYPEGMDESRPLDFHSPYGCSKGAADQYVRDFYRIYGSPSVVFRMSCIYGTRQFGVEDQGWVAHMVISTVLGRPITIYGDGKQVRDILFIDDLVRAMRLATVNINKTAGEVYNIGGGAHNTISVWTEFSEILSRLAGQPVKATGYGDWRSGDQLVYVSNCAKAKEHFGWEPQVGKEEGVTRLWNWVRDNTRLFAEM
jgi:CDP-paratose 2-epimerase